jgi:hypothetical protein
MAGRFPPKGRKKILFKRLLSALGDGETEKGRCPFCWPFSRGVADAQPNPYSGARSPLGESSDGGLINVSA